MSIRAATNLWIEAGGMSGPPGARHQIEFPDAVAQFFRDSERFLEEVVMRPGAVGTTRRRPLTHRDTDYGQWTEIWRLGLPTPAMGGPEYPGRVVRLERVEESGRTIYNVYVDDFGGTSANEWRQRSGANIASTGGPQGREFGYW